MSYSSSLFALGLTGLMLLSGACGSSSQPALDLSYLLPDRPGDAAVQPDLPAPVDLVDVPPAPDMAPDVAPPPDLPPDVAMTELTLESSAFGEGEPIPVRHTCYGDDVQPELSWSDPPAGTGSLAVVLIDEAIGYVHWVAFNLPADTRSLPEGASNRGELPAGTEEARGFGGPGYHGPCPGNVHVYAFRVYALPGPVTFTASDPILERDLADAFGNALAVASLKGNFGP
jgi:Raf kinase inhibitor-like YbhB/YbcL family protein